MIIGYPGKESCLMSVVRFDTLVGMYYTLSDENLLFIFYLAVSQKYRNSGIGSLIMEHICKNVEKPILLNIERVPEHTKETNEKVRRKRFYQQQGFEDTGWILTDSQGEFNVMCRGKCSGKLYLNFLNSFGESDCSLTI